MSHESVQSYTTTDIKHITANREVTAEQREVVTNCPLNAAKLDIVAVYKTAPYGWILRITHYSSIGAVVDLLAETVSI